MRGGKFSIWRREPLVLCVVAASARSCPHLSAPPSGPRSPTTPWALGLLESPGPGSGRGRPAPLGAGEEPRGAGWPAGPGAAGVAGGRKCPGRGRALWGAAGGRTAVPPDARLPRPGAPRHGPGARTALLPPGGREAWLGQSWTGREGRAGRGDVRRALLGGSFPAPSHATTPYSAHRRWLRREPGAGEGGRVRGGVSPEASPNGCNVRQEPGPLRPCPPPPPHPAAGTGCAATPQVFSPTFWDGLSLFELARTTVGPAGTVGEV